MSSASPATIRFACECGAVLKARTQLAGRKGVCGRCGATMIIPLAGAAVTAELIEDDNAIPVSEICGVCQCPIEDDEFDERLTCDRCELPFHTECWEENLGCSAYGCENVNALKMGADITIPASDAAAAAPRRGPPAAPRATDRSAAPEGTPWEYLCMGGAAVVAPLSLVMFGLPSLLVAAAAAMLFINQGAKVNGAPLLIAYLICAAGLIAGAVNSVLYWTW